MEALHTELQNNWKLAENKETYDAFDGDIQKYFRLIDEIGFIFCGDKFPELATRVEKEGAEI